MVFTSRNKFFAVALFLMSFDIKGDSNSSLHQLIYLLI